MRQENAGIGGQGESHMRRIATIVSALMLAAPAIAAAPIGGERLAAPALPGFVTGYSAGNAVQTIREEVPRGETVEA